MTDAQFGLLTTVFLVVYGLLSPFAGYLADRFSRAGVIIASLFFWSLITWLTGHARTYNELLLARTFMGLSEACYIPAALALISDYHRGPTRSLATGTNITGIFVGSGLGGMGGLLAERYGWRTPFSLFGLLGITYSLLLIFVLRDAPPEPGGMATGSAKSKIYLGAALQSLLRRGSFWLILAYWGLLGLAGWATLGWMPTYLKETFHLTQGRAGMSATGYMQAASALGVLVGGAWADRWSRRNARARIFVPFLGLCIAAPGILIASHTTVLAIALGGLMVYGLMSSFTDANMMPIVCMVADPRYRATAYGVLNLFGCLVGGATIYVGGRLRDGEVNIRNVFAFGAASLVVCAVLLLFIRSKSEEIEDR